MSKFAEQNRRAIAEMGKDAALHRATREWFNAANRHGYSYHFEWLGRPVIQYPQDIVAMQEIIWNTRPDLIIETGIAHGGSLIFHASMLKLLGGEGRVLGIDIDIREHNRTEIERHPMYERITMIEGSSTDTNVLEKVRAFATSAARVLVILDSNHTHEHALKEMEVYSPLVTRGSYLVVFDTVIEDLPEDAFPDRPWSRGNNPKTAVWEFLKKNDRFEIDREIQDKLQITVAPDGYLKCVKD